MGKSNNTMVSGSAKKMGPMNHKFERMTVLPADNGYTLEVQMPRTDKQKETYMSPEAETHVFGRKDHKKLLDHMKGMMGVNDGDAVGTDSEVKGGKSKDEKSGKMGKADNTGKDANAATDSDSEEE